MNSNLAIKKSIYLPKVQVQVCTECVMDSSDSDITFNEEGVCNHCLEYPIRAQTRMSKGSQSQVELNKIINRIKNSSKNLKYNCIVGVSGGVDSTYLAYMAKKFGLRPLAVHFDNGWNSELAVSNIENTLRKLEIDLYTYVVDWNEFRELQLSFLKASTPDGEIPTDHGVYGLLMREASRRNIKYIIHGMNYRTEGIIVNSWAYGHPDWKYIRSVHRQHSEKKLKSFPYYSIPYLAYIFGIRRIQFISLLNYIDYDKNLAKEVLKSELEWRDYGGKHHESIYTRFYQSYILPQKFNIDKRKAHLSTLIHASKYLQQQTRFTRDEALQELAKPPMNQEDTNQLKPYVIKKLQLTNDEFERLMHLEIKSFRDYPNNFNKIQFLKKLQFNLRKLKFLYK